MVAVLSFANTQRHKIAEGLEQDGLPVEQVVPKPMFLFGKEISIEGSLSKWEQSLTTNTLTNYEEQVTA